MNTLQLWFTHLNEETLTVLSFMMLAVFTTLVAYWIYNRRKYQQLAHQIPASVVKNYLDSIIQNSSALKSSLFRGGGIDVGDSLSIPSVKPIGELPTGGASAANEEMQRKNAELDSLKAQLQDRDKKIIELESLLETAKAAVNVDSEIDPNEIVKLNEEINDLKEQLSSAGDGASDEEIVQERDELKSRLAEYEIIEDDLANLKKLQQENEQLKKALADQGGVVEEVVVAAEPVETSSVKPAPVQEVAAVDDQPAVEEDEFTGEEPKAAPELVAVAEQDSKDIEEIKEGVAAGEDAKSAEDLLSEFEKMLG